MTTATRRSLSAPGNYKGRPIWGKETWEGNHTDEGRRFKVAAAMTWWLCAAVDFPGGCLWGLRRQGMEGRGRRRETGEGDGKGKGKKEEGMESEKRRGKRKYWKMPKIKNDYGRRGKEC